jgi:hypothetical protein
MLNVQVVVPIIEGFIAATFMTAGHLVGLVPQVISRGLETGCSRIHLGFQVGAMLTSAYGSESVLALQVL